MVKEGRAVCSLTRAVSFHATHSYASGGPSGAHGHLYRVEVTIGGRISPGHEMLIDLATLDRVLTQQVAEPLQGRHLNDAMAAVAPSCEAVAAWCWRRVAAHLPEDVALERIRVAEDATLWADCTGID